MLLQSQTGALQLLPALPDAWGSGSITGIRARGNFVVDMEWKGGRLTKSHIQSGSGVPCTVIYRGIAGMKVKDSRGNTISTKATGDNQISFPTTRGETYTISL
jgi:alpha-L-fucosidase 2